MPSDSSRSTARWAVVYATSSLEARLLTVQKGFSTKRSSTLFREARPARGEFVPPASEQIVYALNTIDSVLSLHYDSPEEVGQPLLPFATLGHAKETCIVLFTSGLEVCAQVEQWRGDDVLG